MKLGSCVKKVTKIAITGKIGSGKTSLCNIIKKIGYKVYESDKEVEKLFERAQIIEEVKLLYKDKIIYFHLKYLKIYYHLYLNVLLVFL